MKLNTFHLFLILAIALILASTLGRYLSDANEGYANAAAVTAPSAEKATPPPLTRPGEKPLAAPADNHTQGTATPSKPAAAAAMTQGANVSNASGANKGSGVPADARPRAGDRDKLPITAAAGAIAAHNAGFGSQAQAQAQDQHQLHSAKTGGIATFAQPLSEASAMPAGRAFDVSKCPPCPACARCPEASFDCKKVPNYSSSKEGDNGLPMPVMADFSQFGM